MTLGLFLIIKLIWIGLIGLMNTHFFFLTNEEKAIYTLRFYHLNSGLKVLNFLFLGFTIYYLYASPEFFQVWLHFTIIETVFHFIVYSTLDNSDQNDLKKRILFNTVSFFKYWLILGAPLINTLLK